MKAYIVGYKAYEIEVRLVKNEWWRWRYAIYKYSGMTDEPERKCLVSGGSNKLTHWGVIKEARKEIDHYENRYQERP